MLKLSIKSNYITHLLAFIISVGYLTLLMITEKDIGYARDEGFYFSAARNYGEWFKKLINEPKKAVTKREVDKHWRENHEHPSFMKTLFALSRIIFYEKLKLTGEAFSLRLPGMIMATILIYFVFIFGSELGSRWIGFLSSLFLAFLPRFFYHAHLCCFDVPISTLWFLTTYSFLKSLNSLKWSLLTSILWGLSLETKLNSFFIPVVMVTYYIILKLNEIKFDFIINNTINEKPKEKFRFPTAILLPPIPVVFILMLIVSPLLFILLWPWLWYDTIQRLGGYLSFHLHHPYYNIEFLGINYFTPPFPFSYPFVMTLFTIPFVTMVFSVTGIILRVYYAIKPKAKDPIKSPYPKLDLFLFLNLFIPMLIIALPTTPIFGGTKHWMPSWPYIAIFGGIGFYYWLNFIISKLHIIFDRYGIKEKKASLLSFNIGMILSFLIITPSIIQTKGSHPFALSHYTMLSGESPGAATLGMNRQFWGFTTRSLLPWINKNAPPNARIYFHDTTWTSYDMYKREGLLRKDINWSNTITGSDLSMIHLEQHFIFREHDVWEWTGTATPSYVVSHQGVAILPIYKRVWK